MLFAAECFSILATIALTLGGYGDQIRLALKAADGCRSFSLTMLGFAVATFAGWTLTGLLRPDGTIFWPNFCGLLSSATLTAIVMLQKKRPRSIQD